MLEIPYFFPIVYKVLFIFSLDFKIIIEIYLNYINISLSYNSFGFFGGLEPTDGRKLKIINNTAM